MRLEPLYRVRFTTPERWTVELSGQSGSEAQSFLVAEGRCEGGVSGRFRAANFPRTRVDGTLLPDFRGVVETDDGAALLFTLCGYFRPATRPSQRPSAIRKLCASERLDPVSWTLQRSGVVKRTR